MIISEAFSAIIIDRRSWVAADKRRHDRSIDDPETIDTDYLEFGVDDCARIPSHPARTGGVKSGAGVIADKGLQIVVTLDARARQALDAAIRRERISFKEVSGKPHGQCGEIDIGLVRKEAEIYVGSCAKVGASQSHPPANFSGATRP